MFAYKYLNLGFEHSSISQPAGKNSLSLSQSAPSPSAWWMHGGDADLRLPLPARGGSMVVVALGGSARVAAPAPPAAAAPSRSPIQQALLPQIWLVATFLPHIRGMAPAPVQPRPRAALYLESPPPLDPAGRVPSPLDPGGQHRRQRWTHAHRGLLSTADLQG